MLGLGLPWIVVHALPAGGRALAWDTGRLWACPCPDKSYIALPGVSAGGLRTPVQWKVRSERREPVMAVAVTSFDNPEVMQVPQGGGQTLFFCSGVALVTYTGTGENWRKDNL